MIAEAGIASYLPWVAGFVTAAALMGLYAGMETGIYVLNKIRLDLRAEASQRSARRLRRLLRNPNNVLAVLLIGTNVAGYFATFCVASMFVLSGRGAGAEWYTIALATPMLFISEAVPKGIFRRVAERAVYSFSWLLWVSHWVFLACGASLVLRGFGAALTALVPRRGSRGSLFAHEGLSAVVAEGRAGGVLTHFQSIMADRVAHLSEVALSDVMVPMKRAAAAPAGAERDELLEIIRGQNHSRLPVLDADGRVVAVLDVYDVLFAGERARMPDKPETPLCLPADTPVTDALWRMQRAGAAMAVVQDGDRHVGIATVKDLVEEIVGELEAW